ISTLNLAPLSGLQAQAADSLSSALGKGFSVHLLDGVTGSGKTEVYFDTIARALKANESAQILILLPEIALSVQFLERFERRFGFTPGVWNSEITPARKRATWQAIATGEARVVVGARSALFLPYRALSLIVIDEEHDGSYKQTEGVVYHARDMAISRARFEGIPAVLVSATPSLESYVNAQAGKYRELSLPSRHNAAAMPSTELIDMRQTPMDRNTFISPPLRQALAMALANKNQSLLFLNRRGYAPLLLCRACGHRFQCPDCAAWLVLHKKKVSSRQSPVASNASGDRRLATGDYLNCHHCGRHEPVPPACPGCAAEDSFHACGPGIERLHEEVADFLPQARIGVLASDATTTMAELSETITAMTEGRIDILIGTQMLAKGHHFANLAVVGVVDAD
ncbi:MAG: primosomal protein N', partial [Rickettsiales bacterium]|nr:primosomal protein N' [Rickettsiales bacterium]